MDLIKELKEIEDNNLPIERLIDNLEEEQVKLAKKVYLLKVMNISKAMNQLSKSIIAENKISGFNLAYRKNYDNYIFSIHLFDYQEKRVKADPQFKEESTRLVELLKNNSKIELEYVSESFVKNKEAKILFNNDIDKQIFDLFLNEELKITLNYSQQSVKLKDKNDDKKRLKIKI